VLAASCSCEIVAYASGDYVPSNYHRDLDQALETRHR